MNCDTRFRGYRVGLLLRIEARQQCFGIVVGHKIKDCWVFKDLVEKRIKAGEIELSEGALQDPAPHEQSSMVSHSIIEEEIPAEEQWDIHLSRKTKKLIKQLQKEPSVKWKDEITPIVPRVFYKKASKNSQKKGKQLDVS